MDYLEMSFHDLASEWGKCRLDDSNRADSYEKLVPDHIEKLSKRWYQWLLLHAQKEGWAE